MPDVMAAAVVRVASWDDRATVEQFYRDEGYLPAIEPSDAIVLLELHGAVLAAVRLSAEHGFLVLRGMRVRADSRRLGLGSRLLRAATDVMGPRSCHCLPFAHLTGFYARAGFMPLHDDLLPPFLRERAARYRSKGEQTVPMLRGAG